MHCLIIGAGGIGGYYGARLLDAGHAVTFVARGDHLAALQRQGLQVSHEDLQFQAPVTALSLPALLAAHHCAEFDLILVTLKSGATADWLHSCADWLRQADTPVLSLQNGVDNEALIADCLGAARTLGGLAVRIGGHIIAPGQIEARGPAQVVMGRWPCAEADDPALTMLADAFNGAGIPTRISSDIRRELWKKLLINNGVNPLSALTGLDTRRLTADPVLGRTVHALMQETARAARADGVELAPADVDEMFELISRFDAIKTSMLVDREKGRPLELDEISGAVIRRCRQLGEPAPNTELVQRLLQLEIRPVHWQPLPA